jgi:hypothetical protein
MKVVALLAVYNEELYLQRCLEHLREQGVETYLIDNGSTDRTPDIARSFLDHGVIGVEVFPRDGVYEWEPLLRRKEELSLTLGADWYMHCDTDEIREAPRPYRMLKEGFEAADRAGYTAVNFDEFVFVPTVSDESFEHEDYVRAMRYYYYFAPSPIRQVKAWKNLGRPVDLHSSGGHRVAFEGLRVYPESFILRHYMVLSHEHAVRKYCGRVYSEREIAEQGWHRARAGLRPEEIGLPDRRLLKTVSAEGTWDRSDPWQVHPLFNRGKRPQPGPTRSGESAREGEPAAPFIVGAGRSGTTLLRLMLDRHPELAIPPETHFVPSLIQGWRSHPDPRRFFLDTVIGNRLWNDFYLSQSTLSAAILEMPAFDLAAALRVFYRLYAERFGKPRWGDKTPVYVGSMGAIQGFLPEARFIHLIRDGRDVAESNRGLWFGPKSVEEAAERWVETIVSARRQASSLAHYLEIRYEDLVLHPEPTLKAICGFLDLSWDPAMLEYHEGAEGRLSELRHNVAAPNGGRTVTGEERVGIHRLTATPPDASRIGRWRTEMPVEDRRVFESIAGSTLHELGYDVG